MITVPQTREAGLSIEVNVKSCKVRWMKPSRITKRKCRFDGMEKVIKMKWIYLIIFETILCFGIVLKSDADRLQWQMQTIKETTAHTVAKTIK